MQISSEFYYTILARSNTLSDRITYNSEVPISLFVMKCSDLSLNVKILSSVNVVTA